MRTTVTLDDDTERVIRQRMRQRGVSFKQALNDSIRDGSKARTDQAPFKTRTADMGLPMVDLDKALQLAGELEDQEVRRQMRAGR